MTYFMSPDSNQRRRRPRGPAQKKPRGPKPKANRSQANDLVMRSPSYAMEREDIARRYIVSTGEDREAVTTLTAIPARLAQVVRPHELVQMRDRKSTRLNSSHRTISYAVF